MKPSQTNGETIVNEKGEYFWVDGSGHRALLATQYNSGEFNRQMSRNAFGLLMWRNDKYPEGMPVICGHGGSMWLCAECAQKSFDDQRIIPTP